MIRSVVHVARGREWRGGEYQVLLLVEALAGNPSLQQLVVTRSDSRLAVELLSHALPVAGVPWSAAWDPRALVALRRQIGGLKRNGARPILHAHDSHALALALLVGRREQVPVVATRRSVTIPGLLWRKPDSIIAISRAVAESLRDAGAPLHRIVVIPSAAASEQFREPAPPRLPAHPPQLLAIGALTSEKGHGTLIRALATLAEVQLTIIGEGEERATLVRLARELGVSHRVTFASAISEPILERADVFVQPSLREALGTATLLAMGRGIPIVASRTGGLVDLLEGGAGLLVAPGDPAALAEAITTGLSDPGLRESMVRTARQRVEDYRPARMADQVADVYASVHCDPD